MTKTCGWWRVGVVVGAWFGGPYAVGQSPPCSAELLNPENATFARIGSGYLYLGDATQMSSFPTGTGAELIRNKTELSCSAGRIDELHDEVWVQELGQDWDVWPWCATGSGSNARLWGTAAWTSIVYQTADGTNWQRMGTAGDGWVGSFFALSTGRLIAFHQASGTWSVSYSDNGQTWTAAATQAGSPPQSTPLGGAPCYVHNFHERPAGTLSYRTLVAVTYQFSGGNGGETLPKEIWRSIDDGATWTRVWQGGANEFKHFHSVVYHEDMDLWVVDTGDSYNTARRTYVSTDNAETWQPWYGTGAFHSSPSGQVTCFRDAGDATRVYIGSDGSLRVGWMDLDTWQVGTFMERQFTNGAAQDNVWDLSHFDDAWYATMESSRPANQHSPVVLMADEGDLSRWAVYGRLHNSPYSVLSYCAGRLGDYVHYLAGSSTVSPGHARVPVGQVAAKEGVCVSPAKTNLLTYAQSRCDTTNAGWVRYEGGNNYSLDLDSNAPFASPSGSLYVLRTNLNYDQTVEIRLANPMSVNPNLAYRFHVWVRGHCKDLGVSADVGGSATATQAALREYPAWTEISSPPQTGTSSLRPGLVIVPAEADQAVELWLGAAEVVAVPADGEWVPGHDPQPAPSAREEFNYEGLEVPDGWTHLFSTVLLGGTDELTGAGHGYIRTYRHEGTSSTTYAELYFDAVDGKFKLALDGGTPIETSSRALVGGTRIYFAVRHNADGELSLSVSDGAGVEHVSTALSGAESLAGADFSIRSGDNSGELVAAEVYLEDVLIRGCALSEGQIEQAFASASLTTYVPPTCLGDTDCDGGVSFSDIDYLVAAISDNEAAWRALYASGHGGQPPPCPFSNCDANGDGHVGFPDIDPFVALIGTTCP